MDNSIKQAQHCPYNEPPTSSSTTHKTEVSGSSPEWPTIIPLTELSLSFRCSLLYGRID